MGNLFSGLDSLGLGNLSEMNVYEVDDTKEKGKKQKEEVKEPEIREADFLFDKAYVCPVCDKEFKNKTVRTGKAKLIAADSDLRPRYQIVDSLKYDVVACPHCGYAALNRYFSYMTAAQAKQIKTQISSGFKGLAPEGEIMTYDESITKHRLALVNAIVKHAKPSEKAYTCLKTAWLLRGKAETMPESTPNRDAEIKKLQEEERDFLENAYNGFMEAFPRELFPMCGMDEHTVSYLVADLARRIGKYEDATHWVSKVLVSRSANDRIKAKARELKDMIASELRKDS